jgi:hypothetical protein
MQSYKLKQGQRKARRGWNLRTWRKIRGSDESRRPDEGLETQKYSLYPKKHPANCLLRWRFSNGLGVHCRVKRTCRIKI